MAGNKMGQSPLFNLIRDTEKDKKQIDTGTKKHETVKKENKDQKQTKKIKPVETGSTDHSDKFSVHADELTVMTAYQQDRKKATYYIRKDLLKKFKMYSAEVERDMSDLVSEAIEGMIGKK
jgi:hypothetical protein